MRLARALFCVLFVLGCGKPVVDFEPLIKAEDERRADDATLRAAAYSDVPELRARAAMAYGRIAKQGCIDPLLDLLYDDDARVQIEAAFALGQLAWHQDALGGRADGIAYRLQRLLGQSDANVRRAAVEATGKLAGNDAAMWLAPQLKDAAPAVRAETAMAFFRSSYVLRSRDPAAPLTPLPDAVMQSLRTLSGDPDPIVRRAVLYLFSRFKDARFSDLLPRLSRDGDLWVRFFAVQAIKRTLDANDAARTVLLQATEDAEYIVRVAAVQALIGLNRAELVPSQLAKDPSHHVRAATADALSSSPAQESLLEDMWEGDARIDVRAAALRNLISLRKRGAESLIKRALSESSYVLRSAAIDASGEIESAAEPLLMTTIRDADEHVRVSTLTALASIDSGWAYTAIKSALAAPGLAERGTAASALSQRREPERIVDAITCYQNSSGRRWIEVREMLIGIFDQDDGLDGIRGLRMALSDPAPSVVKAAIAALKERNATGLPTTLPVAERSESPTHDRRFAQNPVVLMKTSRGELEIECLAQEATLHCASFIGLVEQGYYNGLLWHRVVPNFVIQGGDKEGTGWGDAGYSLRAEINGQRYDRGALGMPRGLDFDTGGSQVFFTHVMAPHLDGQYTVFGRIRRGLEVMDEIEEGDQILQASIVK